MNEDAVTYAKLSRYAYQYYYEPSNKMKIDGYEQVDGFMDTYSIVMANPQKKDICMAIRGTSVTNITDLANDILVITNSLTFSTRATALKRKLQNLINERNEDLPEYTITLTGHSLGASLALNISPAFIDQIHAIYLFNTGYSPKTAIRDFGESFLCRFANTRYCKNRKAVTKKLHIFTSYDPLSIMSLSRGAQLYSPTTGNVHSIDNFTKGGSFAPMLISRTARSIPKPDELIDRAIDRDPFASFIRDKFRSGELELVKHPAA